MPAEKVSQDGPAKRRAVGGFTMVELVVTMAIVAILLAVLLPALAMTLESARTFRCQVSLRSIAFDFTVFADDELHGDRGNDPAEAGRGRFRLETFQESQYGLDEFWRWGPNPMHVVPDASRNDPMRCAEVRGPVTLLNGTPCSQGAVNPPANVSYGFNMRLHRAPSYGPAGQPALLPVSLTSAIVQEARVPLVWDVDGEAADRNGVTPVFTAPTLEATAVFPDGLFWFPGARHAGGGNYAFTDGSVEHSTAPLEEGWRWAYQPVR